MKPKQPEHVRQREQIVELITLHGLAARRDALTKLLAPAIGLQTRTLTSTDEAVGRSRVGGEPDAPDDFEWPEGADGPLLFVMQVDLADVTHFDLDSLLPEDGLLSLFSDRYCDDVEVAWFPNSAALRRHEWAAQDQPFTACGVAVLPELQLPPPSSAFVSTRDSTLVLSPAEHEVYREQVWRPWRARQRPGNTGEAGIHQVLGYAVGNDLRIQAANEVVLFGFDSDDRAAMEWGDVQCVWALIERGDLLDRAWSKLHAVT